MNNVITLVCPSCGGKTTFQNNTSRMVCQYCGNEHIFQLEQPAAQSRGGLPRPTTPRPNSIKVQMRGSELMITWRWFSARYIPLIFFCIAWDAFLVFWYGMAFGTNAPWIFTVFPIGHLAVGVGMSYYTLAGLFNHTTIKLNGEQFLVQHDPFPWFGEVKVPLTDLRQLYCLEKRAKTREGSTSYELAAMLADGRKLTLLSSLDSPEIGLFLEQQVESWLHIEDVPVAGELAR
jgi:predicted RNA-binding Zn-ribbon protein involved in translation (DUF1610 family)